MLGALPTAHERHLAGSAHGMTAMVEAEGINRRAPAALIGPGDASASRDLVGLWRGFSRACWLGLQTGALESGDVLLAPSLRLPAAHGSDFAHDSLSDRTAGLTSRWKHTKVVSPITHKIVLLPPQWCPSKLPWR